MAAFPAGYAPNKASPLTNEKNVSTQVLADGSIHQYSIGTVEYVVFKVTLEYLTASERSTIRTFLRTNRYNTVTWTIDSINYSGVIDGGYSERLAGDRYTIQFKYRAAEV